MKWKAAADSCLSNYRSFLDGELLKVAGLHHRRAPGSTCLSALIAGKMGGRKRGEKGSLYFSFIFLRQMIHPAIIQ